MTIAVPNAGLTLTMTFLSWLVEGSLFTFLVSYSLSHDDFFTELSLHTLVLVYRHDTPLVNDTPYIKYSLCTIVIGIFFLVPISNRRSYHHRQIILSTEM